MQYYFVSSEGEGGDIVNSANVAFSTVAGSFDSALCRGSMRADSMGEFRYILGTAVTDYWLSFEAFAESASSNATTLLAAVTLKNASNQGLFRLVHPTNTNSFAFQYWNGSAWTTIGSEIAWNLGSRDRYTIHVTRHASAGVVELYRNGALLTSFAGNTQFVADTAVKYMHFMGRNNTSTRGMHYSQVLVTDGDNRAKKVGTLYPTGAGAYAEQASGVFSDVAEAIDATDASVLTLDASGKRATFAMADLAAGAYSTWQVEALVVATRAEHNAAGPQNIKHKIRTAATDYTTANLTNLSSVFARQQSVWEVNPNTGQRFTQSEINAIEIGVESAT